MQRRSSFFRGVTRASAATLAGLALLGLVAACRDIVSPKTVDIADQICDLSVQCDGLDWSCPDRIRDALQGDPVEVDAFMQYIASADCLEDCRSVRVCRDRPPICAGISESCNEDRDCCEVTLGISVCGEQGRCCVPDGAPCNAPNKRCCDGRACDADLRCGSVVCALVGDRCSSNFDCCSLRCGDTGECVANTCTRPGDFCKETAECCDPPDAGEPYQCLLAADGSGTVCRRPGQECICDPLDPDNCCLERGQICFATGDGLSICASPTCPPVGAECGGDIDCLCFDGTGPDLLCDDAFVPHCSVCRSAGSRCFGNAECCEGVCDESGRCALGPDRAQP